MVISLFLCVFMAYIEDARVVQEWDFREPAVAAQWRPNAHLVEVTHEGEAFRCRAVDWDPFFISPDFEMVATASQCVLLRIRASAPGRCQLFWTGEVDGPFEGFSEKKVTNFSVGAASNFQDIVLFPFWQREGHIRRLRLDLYDGAQFEIARMAVVQRPITAVDAPRWAADDVSGLSGWLTLERGLLLAAPAISVPVEALGWISIRAQTSKDVPVLLDWSTSSMLGGFRETVWLRGGTSSFTEHIEMHGHPGWEGELVGLTLRLPEETPVKLERVSVTEAPEGPAEVSAVYFGFEHGGNRAGRPESVFVRLGNRGGGKAFIDEPVLELSGGARVLSGPTLSGDALLGHGDTLDVGWEIEADGPGVHEATARWNDGEGGIAMTRLEFGPAVTMTATYPPEPVPVPTWRDVLAYYFPGWEAAAKWECIRHGAPVRKPMLGYYDEANPECVDWQIKWAVENGIRAFLVDWYWVDGAESLLHWFEAYRTARYRDYLEVAIMWANHNPPGSHSREDWRKVTQEWIDRYFTLETYYRIDGKPAVFLWDAALLRDDLGGSEAVAEAFAESQEMARAAGYEGIAFVVLQHHLNQSDVDVFAQEGYHGHTSYHEFGDAYARAPSPSRGRFADVVETAPAAWERRRGYSDAVAYYPVVDTGWDSRPWHGANAMAYHGRNVDGFRSLLEAVREYCDRHEQDIVILGPLNEWGEGSYIEPNLEFGFGMYEAIRSVFGKGAPESWPENYAPRDLGLGPYDLPAPPQTFAWDFEEGAGGWAVMMNIADLRVEGGSLCFTTASGDPALVASTRGLAASERFMFRTRMKVSGEHPETSRAQLFWSVGDGAITEATSIAFSLERDDEFHEYAVDLSQHPRWRGKINMVRFDPSEFANATVHIDSIAFE